ncbi:NAD(P)/FAD-dependent oxidoreductase [Bordetella petrii]|uniref:D-amino acid dehydrogenase, small subunit n=1 Tax=Bordetella petrii (strain ATCC BAA-461 / DSM 12804 / CCUG 43448 / CIP 107267 / Se-1111R) TaxID=340100 RepID=A9IDR0_BORPD|nr:FAD-binding oxidoreductase [Bordetella petrii]CAP41594.1 D-amino acid dehydrogenase, small subunit [Bordetella petrii]
MPHVIIVGAGIVGLSCALAARRRGWDVTVVDRDFEGDRASHGNAGGIAVSECVPLSLAGMGLKPLRWLLDPLGPLAVRPAHAPRLLPWYLALRKVSQPQHYARIGDALAALNRRSLADFEAMLAEIGLSGDLHKLGALTVYETSAAFEADQASWQFKRERGVRWRVVDQAELRALEPGLAPVFKHAVMLEDWAHIDDPKRIVDVLREQLIARQVKLVTGEAVKLDVEALGDRAGVMLSGGQRILGDRVVVATGAWSARLAESIGERALLESERGYNTTLPASAQHLRREVIFAERMFVATPLAIGLRIGGAAEFAGLQAPANYKRSAALLKLAHRYLPGLNEANAQQWMGNRPTTADSLPVIGPSRHSKRILYAFGHGHLGLTQSATTAHLIGELLDDGQPSIDLAPYSISRF